VVIPVAEHLFTLALGPVAFAVQHEHLAVMCEAVDQNAVAIRATADAGVQIKEHAIGLARNEEQWRRYLNETSPPTPIVSRDEDPGVELAVPQFMTSNP